MLSIWMLVATALIGTGLGTMTGLIPGLHVNTVAILLLSASAVLATVFGGGLGIAIVIACAATAHTFLDFIPSAFLGIPDADTALSVLPAHSMVMQGRGYEASCLSAMGSALAILVCLGLFLPYRMALIELGGYELLRENIILLLFGLCALLIVTEQGGGRGRLSSWTRASFVLLISGIFGIVALRVPAVSPVGLPGSILFPILAGIFGIPPLISSIGSTATIPEQSSEPPRIDPQATAVSVTAGTLSGSVLGFIPGMTSAHATVLSMVARGEKKAEQVIVTLSSVNTANSFYSVMALFIIGTGRSGAALAMADAVDLPLWMDSAPASMVYIMIGVIISAVTATMATLLFGRLASKTFSKLPYRTISMTIMGSVIIMAVLFTGPIGLFVLFTGTLIGSLPMHLGVRRSHAMGVLLIPVILYLI